MHRSDAGSRRSDLLAGLTVAAMLVPQGMAYAAQGSLEVACRAAEVELHLAGVRAGVAGPLRRAHLDTRFVGRWHEDVATALDALTSDAARATSAQPVAPPS